MHDSVAAIRANRPRTRFAAHAAQRHERQMGLRRTSRALLAAAPGRSRTPPLLALHRAARTLAGLRNGPRRAHGLADTLPRGRGTAMSWSRQPEPGRRMSRGRSATPWRG
ncbi:hypothetical protein BH24CHL6_BH24CHL6_04980 [soil metagenome]